MSVILLNQIVNILITLKHNEFHDLFLNTCLYTNNLIMLENSSENSIIY